MAILFDAAMTMPFLFAFAFSVEYLRKFAIGANPKTETICMRFLKTDVFMMVDVGKLYAIYSIKKSTHKHLFLHTTYGIVRK
ncbi:hypothetical protein PY95_01395 [Lacticaseibacillus rhamnosus]|nr:hypothetical protein PY95_01395 [Lacticaseibacillus rhamnosus]OAT94207.1 hypothetical protein PY94_06475 [Lacticaseibacillus rhamnosus]OAU06821.1 hypothetical protein PY72_01395 [Lacticaseibacillus rhamnosus]CDN23339.1 hypothetical protein BN934_01581 [Lacticaseibacillus rhamnosus]